MSQIDVRRAATTRTRRTTDEDQRSTPEGDRIAVTATEADWRALLAALPGCDGCGAAAEVTLIMPGSDRHRVCLACAAQRRRGRAEPLAHGDAVEAIEGALLRAAGVPA